MIDGQKEERDVPKQSSINRHAAEVPEGWVIGKLEDCVDILDHLRVPVNSDERKDRSGDVPYYGATGQVGWIDGHLFDEELVLLGEDGAPFFDKTKDIAYVVKGKSWVNNHAHVLRAVRTITSSLFVKHSLQVVDFSESVTGSTRHKLTQGAMRQISIVLPPLAEQRRIVAKVEELLAHVNAARERLAKVPQILKVFRQSVLAAACSGRLTEDWRSEHVEVQRLLGASQEDRVSTNWTDIGQQYEPNFDKRERQNLPEGWRYGALGSLGEWGGGGTPSKSRIDFWTAGCVPWVSPKDMKADVLYDSADHITESAVASANLRLFPTSTLLFVVRGMILAHSFPVAMAGVPLTVNQDIRTLVPTTGIRSDYLLRAIQNESRSILFAVRESTHGTRRLESDTLKTWPIPVPPVKEQEEISRRVDVLLTLAGKFMARLRAAESRTEKLFQAILAKAFRGGLVPPEAELARVEGRTFESASLLLEQLQVRRPPNSSVPARLRARSVDSGNRFSEGESRVSQVGLPLAGAKLDSEADEVPSDPKDGYQFQHHGGIAPLEVDRETDELMAAFRRAATGRSVISREELLKEVSLLLGYQRLIPRLNKTLRNHLRAALRRRILATDGPNVWLETPTMDSYTRDELIDTLLAVMRKGVTYEREEVLHAAARHLGFQRLRDTVRAPLESAVNSAIRRGLLGYQGAQLWRKS